MTTSKGKKKTGSQSPATPVSPVASAENAPDAALPIVGIGASAGGLEAFEQFFRACPADSGMAFVLVPHLDPDHESLLDATDVSRILDSSAMTRIGPLFTLRHFGIRAGRLRTLYGSAAPRGCGWNTGRSKQITVSFARINHDSTPHDLKPLFSLCGPLFYRLRAIRPHL